MVAIHILSQLLPLKFASTGAMHGIGIPLQTKEGLIGERDVLVGVRIIWGHSC